MDETVQRNKKFRCGTFEIFSILLPRLVYIILITMVISAAVFFYMYRTMTPAVPLRQQRFMCRMLPIPILPPQMILTRQRILSVTASKCW